MLRRILIVDDNEDIHELMSMCLVDLEDDLKEDLTNSAYQSCQLKIDSAFQGEQAVAMANKAYLESSPYDVIFMDVRMPPGIDGIEAISRIVKQYPKQNFVICSAYSDYTLEEMVGRITSKERKIYYLPKPFTMKNFCSLTSGLLYPELIEQNIEDKYLL
ncbi:response regulator receiver domain protein [Bacteriovorax sp. BAL6_X]|uniref:response regulator n=1 Tax=Bacteriovorax sp. BAL6_X TaxID=1201290 RepID=UPI0003859BBD|nr:response regulator [Bacteriovorax sp. BAL6_X]EPZ52350.1 response regulator receiver domain protein [Bacteriovorax sp. BAL6_X]